MWVLVLLRSWGVLLTCFIQKCNEMYGSPEFFARCRLCTIARFRVGYARKIYDLLYKNAYFLTFDKLGAPPEIFVET